MADNVVEIEFFAKQNDLMAKLVQQQTGFQKSIDKLEKVSAAAQKTGDNLGDAFDKGSSAGDNLAGKILSVNAALAATDFVIGKVKTNWDDMISRQKEAAGSQVSLANAQSEALRNLGKDASITSGKDLTDRLRAMSVRVGVKESSLTSAASSALSSRANLPATGALSAVEAAAKLAPDLADSGGLNELASASMQLQRKGLTPEQALGFFVTVGKASPVASMRDTARNVAPAVSKVSGFGGTLGESGALVSALASGMVDATGEESGTASIRLAEQLAERLPMMGSTRERIEAIQKDPKLREKILGVDGGSFRIKDEMGRMRSHKFPQLEMRAGAVVPVRELLSGKGGTTTDAFSAFLKDIPEPGKESAAVYDEEVARRGELDTVKNADLKRRSEASAERTRTGDNKSSRMSIARDALEDNSRAGETSLFMRFFQSADFNARTMIGRQDPVEAASDILRQQQKMNATDAGVFGDPEAARRATTLEDAIKSLTVAVKENTKRPIKIEAPAGARPKPAGAGLGAEFRK